jgi:tRNA (cytidine56-2'-O)-methyltransferase
MLEVLRIGHRPDRDRRMTTHVCLTARALGADRVLVDAADRELEERIQRVVEAFGGTFEVTTGVAWRPLLRSTGSTVVHLTMYGENAASWSVERWQDLRARGDVMVVVGATKVPGEVYELAGINAAVGNQPHSEVAALAVFLDRLTEGRALSTVLDGRLRIVGHPRGKTVIDRQGGLAQAPEDEE